MNVQLCVALLALCSLTAAADPDCEELVKPVEDKSRLSGKWILYAGASDNVEDLRKIKSSQIVLSITPDSSGMTLEYGDKVEGSCHYGTINSTFIGNSTQVKFQFDCTHAQIGKYLVTCPDCVAMLGSVTERTRDERYFYMFTKTGTLDASDFEVFKKQATCLNFQPDFHLGDATDLCPDAPDAKGKEQ